MRPRSRDPRDALARARVLPLVVALLAGGTLPAAAETLATLTLDGLSYLSFQDEQVLALAPGSTIRFRFGAPRADGSLPFTIDPADVALAPVPVPGERHTLRYALARPASGTLRASAEGQEIHFTASLIATLDGPRGGGSLTYTISFSTETASARDRAGTQQLSVTGQRLVRSARHVQLVGATTNRDDAYPKPGAAVYAVLSGQFDRLP